MLYSRPCCLSFFDFWTDFFILWLMLTNQILSFSFSLISALTVHTSMSGSNTSFCLYCPVFSVSIFLFLLQKICINFLQVRRIYHEDRRFLLEPKEGKWKTRMGLLRARQWSQSGARSPCVPVSRQDSAAVLGWWVQDLGRERWLAYLREQKAGVWSNNILVGGNSWFRCPKTRGRLSPFPPPNRLLAFIFTSLFTFIETSYIVLHKKQSQTAPALV